MEAQPRARSVSVWVCGGGEVCGGVVGLWVWMWVWSIHGCP